MCIALKLTCVILKNELKDTVYAKIMSHKKVVAEKDMQKAAKIAKKLAKKISKVEIFFKDGEVHVTIGGEDSLRCTADAVVYAGPDGEELII
jgi:hypothetical protein